MKTVTVKGVSTPTGVVTGGTQLGPTITLDKGQGRTQKSNLHSHWPQRGYERSKGMTAGGATDP